MISVRTNKAHSIPQNSCDNLPSYPPESHHWSDVVYWRDRDPVSIAIACTVINRYRAKTGLQEAVSVAVREVAWSPQLSDIPNCGNSVVSLVFVAVREVSWSPQFPHISESGNLPVSLAVCKLSWFCKSGNPAKYAKKMNTITINISIIVITIKLCSHRWPSKHITRLTKANIMPPTIFGRVYHLGMEPSQLGQLSLHPSRVTKSSTSLNWLG